MNTDDLIDFLSTRVEAVDPRRQDRIVALAVFGSLAATALVCMLTLGLRPDMVEAVRTPDFALKIGFLAAVVAIAFYGLRRAARAGTARSRALLFVLLPLGLVWLAAGIELASLSPSQWYEVVMFREWRLCVVAIPLLSVLPLALLTLVLREAVPTELPHCGALMGLLAGGIGALAYAAYCLNDTPVYVGLWYATGIAVVTVFGWAMGPRLLRW
ncbi:NrsF family protein [Xanthobacter autotrophicus]|uniref:NrsF family protein n=1 Tax=Xanthobacter autotrophicus TaxID=280 RepID=UPI00372BE8E7